VHWDSNLSMFYCIFIALYFLLECFFLLFKLTECYKAVNNWTELLKWKEKEAELWINQNGGTPHKYVSSDRNTHLLRLRHLCFKSSHMLQ
jgi:hypothetical protein